MMVKKEVFAISPTEERTVILNASIVTPAGLIDNGVLSFTNGVIDYAGSADKFDLSATKGNPVKRIDASGKLVVPGFIDVHVHGGCGCDFMDASKEAFDRITAFHGSQGTTSIVATTVTASKQEIEHVLAAAKSYMASPMPGAQLVGVHLEGPFISPKRSGAQNSSYIAPANIGWLSDWERDYPGVIRIVTLAPEIEGAYEAISWLTKHGIAASLGHTDATYDQVMKGVEHGLRHAAHTFNAMTPLQHREPGAVGAILSNDRISAEVIADGHHVHPAIIRILHNTKKNGNLILVTDAISAAGMGDGTYSLGGLEVVVQSGAARLAEGGNLAGSTLTTISAFKHVVHHAGLSVTEASRLISGNPAKLLGIDHVTGYLEAGKQADVLLLNRQLDLERIWIKGRTLNSQIPLERRPIPNE